MSNMTWLDDYRRKLTEDEARAEMVSGGAQSLQAGIQENDQQFFDALNAAISQGKVQPCN